MNKGSGERRTAALPFDPKAHNVTAQRTTGVVVMNATIHNQNSEFVLTGEQKYLLRL